MSEMSYGNLVERSEIWKKLGWENAGTYHEGRRDYSFLDSCDKPAFSGEDESPIERIPLEKADDWIEQYIAHSEDGVTIEKDAHRDLSLIFDLCFGERAKLDRNSEVFFLSIGSELGLVHGLYRYNAKENSLDLLETGAIVFELLAKLRRDTKLMKNDEFPFGIFFITAMCDEAMWRFGDACSWRETVLDVGHAEQMCNDTCAALGYEYRTCHKFDARSIASSIGIDLFKQPILSVSAVYARR